MKAKETNTLFRNYIVNALDGGFYGFGVGFASFSTVIPLFVDKMTDSAILIGMISAVHVMGWQVPQLFMARSVSRLTRYKPMVMWMTINERVPYLGLTLIALFYRQLGSLPAIILTFLMLAWQGLGAGFTANPWQNMINKVIPGNYLATFFGVQSSAANLLSSGAAVAAGLLLERQPFPMNFVWCFVACFAMMCLSYTFLGLTHESEHENSVVWDAQPPLMHSIRDILKRDRNFDAYLIARTLVQFGTMAFSFYMIYASVRLAATPYVLGILTSVSLFSQVITNLVLGWAADRWSRKGVLELGAVSIFLSAMIARFAPSVDWMYPAVILSAVANTAFWSISMAMTLDFSSESSDRPTYVGMANTLIAPATIIAPLVGGWLADAQGYTATFLFAGLAGLISVIVFHFFVRDPQKGAAVRVENDITPV